MPFSLPRTKNEERTSLIYGDRKELYGSFQRKKDAKETSPQTKSGISGLFRYTTNGDLLILFIGLIFASIHGASFPILALVFGEMTNTFMKQATWGFRSSNSSMIQEPLDDFLANETEKFSSTTTPHPQSIHLGDPLSEDEFLNFMGRFSFYYFLIGLAVLVTSFIQTYCWELACERQVFRLRKIFFSQVLRQDVTWFDMHQHGDLSTKLSDDLERIREGIGSKFSMVLQYVATFISGISVGFYANWKLTAVILLAGPLLIGTSAFMAKVASSSAAREQLKYSLAGGIADEVLTSLRTVAAFGGEPREIQRYEVALDEGRKMAMKKYYVLSLGLFLVFFVMYSSYGLAFWYGSELIASGYSSPGSVFTVFFSVMTGAFSLGNALPYVNAVSTAIGAASTIFGIIDRVPHIDPYSKEGILPDTVEGHIKIKKVNFSYPTRPSVQVLRDLSLDIHPGEKVAIVGASGAGKSTINSLLQRFYDPTQGQILLDGKDLTTINLKWLRSQIGVVSQEPVLFGTSIAENIKYGRENITMQEIIQAATLAEIHSFIKSLPQGYDTLVGDKGAQLSGGQKQRVAIARAIVRDPAILILDEATSALDAESEGIVQAALDNAMQGRTTIIIAHRLSTIKNADVIHAMKDGQIAESGTHSELMKQEGLYYNLVIAQSLEEGNVAENEEDDSKPTNGKELQRGLSVSSNKSDLQKSTASIHKDKDFNVSMVRLLKLNAPEWPWLLFGLISCGITGAVMPIFAFFYSQMFATFSLVGDELRSASIFWSIMFVVLGFVSGLSYWIQVLCMSTAAEKLVAKLRFLAMKNIIRQPISWFDNDNFSPGQLITRLARDAPLVKAAAGLRFGQVVAAMVTLTAAISIALFYGWKLALLLIIGVPLIIMAAYYQMSLIRNNQKRDTNLMDQAGKVASECIQNVTTVQSLGREELFHEMYMGYLLLPYQESKKQAFVFALVFALSQAVIYMMYAGAFRFGAYLIGLGEMTPSEVYRVFFALAFCASSVGQQSAYVQDFTKAKLAAKMLFDLIDAKSEVDPMSPLGAKPVIRGKVAFENVEFSYPTRKNIKVLRGLNISVEPGKTLALVGGSGCGKSTVIALLERFYKPDKGKILLDGIDVRAFNLAYLRSQIGLVTQEPVLFDCTIRENIVYGAQATGESVTDHQIIEAAKAANIHNFIVTLPQGYDTPCGERGTQLSGGQKQRIAIARALIRNPKILLLDEATSAMDTENEKVVQEALDKARQGRTCIVIAHRLSTIQNADRIAVIHHGQVAELGTHEELKSQNGIYYQLIKRQQF